MIENRLIARGTVWLTLQAGDDRPAAYEPGHVVSLALENEDGSLQRHAYTVSGSDPHRRRFSHLYRVIRGGRLTPRLERLHTGDGVYFQGPYHNPIHREIDPLAGRIIGVSTGTGIGPLYGFARKALSENEPRPIALYAGFRNVADTALGPEMEKLACKYPNFSYVFSLTQPFDDWSGPVGRVQDSVPEHLRMLEETHLHLVGRGDMVHLWRKSWIRAGLEGARVSTETYFHHDSDPGEADIITLARALRSRK